MSEKPSWTKWVPDAMASTARARVCTSSRIPQRRSAMTISITRVYTRLGDHGETGLVGGQRVPKDSPRIVAYGTIVEPVNEWPLRYVNRLSDAFFVLGRWVGKHMGEKEYLWERGLSAHSRPRKKRS